LMSWFISTSNLPPPGPESLAAMEGYAPLSS
jgi:hypothetical protein